MDLFKYIKAHIPPHEIDASGNIENLMREMADESAEFENLLVEYGIKCFIKKMNKKIKNRESGKLTLKEVNKLCKKAYNKSCHGKWKCTNIIAPLDKVETFYIHTAVLECLFNNLRASKEKDSEE